MKIVILDGYTANPGDMSWKELEALGELTVYDRTKAEETVARAAEAEIVLTNKVIISREVISQLPRLKYIGVLATGYNVVDIEAAHARGIVVTNVPAYSTCFWINDKRLLGYESRGRWQYRYNNMSNRYGYTISYVGAEKPLDTIEEGSLIRLSLAHWWKPEDSDDEERCYLQLSGCLIQGKPKEDKMPWEPQGDVPSVVDEKKDDMPSFEVAPQKQNQDWFDEYERELDELLLEKANVEEKIKELRSQLLQQMEDRHLDKYTSTKYSVNYYPLKTILQFDRKTFKEENEELYSSYCVPKQKDASIVIRKNRNNSESQTI